MPDKDDAKKDAPTSAASSPAPAPLAAAAPSAPPKTTTAPPVVATPEPPKTTTGITSTNASGTFTKQVFTDRELKAAFNAMHVRAGSRSSGLVAFDHEDKPLPIEKMTPVQRAAFLRMDTLYRGK